MALSHVASSAWVYSIASVTPTLPTGTAAGDLVVMFLVSKYDDASIGTPPAGWTDVGGVSNTGRSTGNDNGNLRGRGFYKIWQAGDSMPTLNPTPNNVSAAKASTYRIGAGNQWDVAGVMVADDTTGTPLAFATATTNLNFIANDYVHVDFGVNSDAATFAAATTVSNTGVTFGTVNTTTADSSTTSGTDMRNRSIFAPVNSITTPSGNFTASTTLAGTTTNSVGVALVLRIREIVITPKTGSESTAVSVSETAQILTTVTVSASDSLSIGLTESQSLPPTLFSSWVGAPTQNSVKIVAHTGASASVSSYIKYSVNSDMSGFSTTSTVTTDAQGVGRHSITGLNANTTYYYNIVVNSAEITGGQFKTAPTGPTTFSFGFGSCRSSGNDTPTMGRSKARGISFFILDGDMHYENIAVEDASLRRAGYEDFLNQPSHLAVVRDVPTMYTYDDHDSCGNSSDKDSTGWTTVQSVYRERVPHYTLRSTTGVEQSWTWGNCLFIMLDTRAYRDDNGAAQGPTKTMLGTSQKQWVKDLVANSTEAVIFIISSVGWIGGEESGQDHWGWYPHERQELANSFGTKPVIFLSGDMHALGLDDGTNAVGGYPCFHSSPIRQSNSVKGGPYSHGTYSAGNNLYANITVTDTGTGSVDVTYNGYITDNTLWQTYTKTYTAAIPKTASDSGSIAVSEGAGSIEEIPVKTASDTSGIKVSETAIITEQAGAPSGSGLTFVKAATGTGTAAVNNVTMTFGSAPTAGNLLVMVIGSDKNSGNWTAPTGWTEVHDMPSTSTTLYSAWKISDGTETNVTASWTTATAAGAYGWIGEYSPDRSGTIEAYGSAQNLTNETSVLSWSSGTTGTIAKDGLAIAFVSIDSTVNQQSGSWSNGFSNRYIPPSSSGRGGPYVGEGSITAGNTAESTWTGSPTADQLSGGIIVFGVTSAPTGSGNSFLFVGDGGAISLSESTTGAGGTEEPVVGSESNSLAVTESAAVAISSTATESNSLAVTDTAVITKQFSSSDTASLATTETTSGAVTAVATETNSLAVTEAGNVANAQPGVDSAAIAVAETTSGSITAVASESNSIAVSETSTLFITKSGSDTTSIAVAESVSGAVSATASESNSLAVNDISNIATTQPGADAAALAVAETSSGAITAVASDSGSIAVTETVTILVTRPASDTASLTVSETTSGSVTAVASDTSALAITDIGNIATAQPGADSAALAVAETTSGAVTASATDTGSIAVSETTTTAVTQPAADAGALTVSESVVIAVTITATETNSLAVSDASATTSSDTKSATDAAVLIVNETYAFGTVAITASEPNPLGISESVSGAVTAAASESNSLAISEASTAFINRPGADTASLAVSESVDIVVSGTIVKSAAETNSLAVLDDRLLGVITSAAETNSLAVSDTGNIQTSGGVEKTASDTGSIAVSETTARAYFLSRTDTAAITATEAVSGAVTAAASESNSLGVAEARSFGTVARTASESNSLAVTESATVTTNFPGTDAAILSVSETSNVVPSGIITKTASDTSAITATDVATAAISIVGTDAAALAVSESYIFGTVTRTAADTTAVSVTEGTQSFRTLQATDTAALNVADATAFGSVPVSASDTSSLAVAEAATVNYNLPGTDTFILSVSESTSVVVSGTLTKAGTDVASISVSESTAFGTIPTSANDTIGLHVTDTGATTGSNILSAMDVLGIGLAESSTATIFAGLLNPVAADSMNVLLGERAHVYQYGSYLNRIWFASRAGSGILFVTSTRHGPSIEGGRNPGPRVE